MRPKCTGIDAVARRDRQQDRYQDGDRGDRIEEAADDQHQDVDEDQEHPLVVGKREDEVGEELRRLAYRQQPGEDRCRGDDEQNGGRRLDRVEAGFGKGAQRHRAVAHQAEKQRPDDRGDGGLGRREPAHGHAADQDDRRHQRHHSGEVEVPVERHQGRQARSNTATLTDRPARISR